MELLIGILIGAAAALVAVRMSANSTGMVAKIRSLVIGGGGGPDPTNP